MRLKINCILIIFLSLINLQSTIAQRINPTQQIAAMDSIKVLLVNYSRWHSFTEDGISVSDSIIQKFHGLFDGAIAPEVINDIIPGKAQGKNTSPGSVSPGHTSISIADYLSNVKNDFQRGLFVSIQYDLDYQTDILFNNKSIS